MRATAITVVALLIVVGAVGALASGGSGPEPQPDRRPMIADEGSYAGVGIGDSPRTVPSRFGRCTTSDGAITPLGYDLLGEEASPDSGTPGPIARDKPARYLRCRLVSFGAKQGKIFSVYVVDPAAETARGVGRGDPLDRVRDVYPEVRCEVHLEDTEYTSFPQCHGRLRGGPHVWFGGDPIRVIAYSTESFSCGGSCPPYPRPG